MVVLYGPINPEGLSHIKFHIVKLCKWQLFYQIPPVFSLVVGDRDASVVCCKDVVGVIGINPHTMLVGVDFSEDGFRSGPTIGGDIYPEAHGINPVLVVRIYSYLGEYPSISSGVPRHIFLRLFGKPANLCPGISGIV